MPFHGAISLALTSGRRALLCVCVALTTLTAPVSLRAAPEAPTIVRARELLDSYHGEQAKLEDAAALIKKAHEANPKDAHVYLQAARAVVLGGFLGFGRYEAGSFDSYVALLDRSLELDPTIPKTHILKAQVYGRTGHFPEELRELEAAKALGTQDPWLKIEYARYNKNIGKRFDAYHLYREIEDAGPGTSASERNAFCEALMSLHGWRIGDEDMEKKKRRLAAAALKARIPTDAWTPLSWAEVFIGEGMFDDGIAYGRESLKTRDFGGARMALALGLYVKAAQEMDHGKTQKDPGVQALIREANALKVPRSALLQYLGQYQSNSKVTPYRAALEKIVL
ncbi:tetratricopeptide repeat protein [Ramlibacter sp. AN1133]|uniref:tetratricopeptide repeat protein n=1 Tax=Ramlibacter sp. AN1133 TaxID=3133429 RepID=UPI0030BCC30F